MAWGPLAQRQTLSPCHRYQKSNNVILHQAITSWKKRNILYSDPIKPDTNHTGHNGREPHFWLQLIQLITYSTYSTYSTYWLIDLFKLRQYQVDPTDLTPENGQKPLFLLFGSFKKAFLWSLNDPSWPGYVSQSWKTSSTIIIHNIKSIQQTKLQKMAKNHFFGLFDHSKRIFVIFEQSFMTK